MVASCTLGVTVIQTEFSALDLLGAARWDHAVFTTFALSLSFFEAVALDALVRKGSAPPLVLADVTGVRGALSEFGARVVGKDYNLEPISVDHGVMHAKIAALLSADDGHLVVGSGNLTFSGWGGNLEVAEHLHPSFAASAFDDAASFFRDLAATPRAKHASGPSLDRLASEIDRRAVGLPRDGNIRLLHNISEGLISQLGRYADELGGATKVIVAAPYWDRGAALGTLCKTLGVSEAHVHAHDAGILEGRGVDNWPRGCELPVIPISLDWLAEDRRTLHAKVFEIQCRRGRLILSGSPNGTSAALTGLQNIEAAVLRVYRLPMAGWTHTAGTEPAHSLRSAESETDGDEFRAILRAELKGGRIEGRIVTPFPAGEAVTELLAGGVVAGRGEVSVDREGHFSWQSEGVERHGWASGRIILRVSSAGKTAEGFVSFADLPEIRRRTGSAAARLFAILAQTDTPEDAVALIAWVSDNPQGLTREFKAVGGGWRPDAPRERPLADIQELLAPATGSQPGELPPNAVIHDSNWRNFLENLFAAMSAKRAAQESDDDEDGGDSSDDEMAPPTPAELEAARKRAEARRRKRDAQAKKAFANFDKHFERTLEAPTSEGLGILVALTQYVCAMLSASEDRTRGYLQSLTAAVLKLPDAPRELVTATVLAEVTSDLNRTPTSRAKLARRRLLRRGWIPDEPTPNLGAVKGFLDRLSPNDDLASFWRQVVEIRTIQEEIQQLKADISAENVSVPFDILSRQSEWPRIKSALEGSVRQRRSIYFVGSEARTCPCSSSALPTSALHELRSYGIVTTTCGHLLLCEEF